MKKRAHILHGPDDTCPAYLRARLSYIESMIAEHPDRKSKEFKLLQYGVFLNEKEHEGNICLEMDRKHFKNHPPLSFEELTRYNNWFALHPEKVAGVEAVTTSMYFPLTIKGTAEDVTRTIHRFISSEERWQKEREMDKEMNKLKARALQLKIKLLKHRKHK